MQPFQGLVNNE